jgi:hypothetical protein
MNKKIEQLKSSGLKEMSGVAESSNTTLTTPESQKINLFNLGM